MPKLPMASLLITLLITTTAWACRYTVREIGFVNLQGDNWTLFQVGNAPSEELLRPEGDVNLDLGFINPSDDPNHPAAIALNGGHGYVIVGTDGRARALGDMSREQAIDQCLTSDLRSTIAREALDTFAFVLVVPGPDAEENARARAAAATAQQQLTALAPHLPKPVKNPLQVIELTPEQAEEEDILLWSIGADDTSHATLVVMYGRGRRAGPPIQEDYEGTELTTQLALIGESCECETDRAWLKEPIALMQSDEVSRNAPDRLGFDPASPMVQAEIVRILARGDFGSGRQIPGQGDGRRPKDLAEIVFGYTERSLDERFGDNPRTIAEDRTTVSTAPSPSPALPGAEVVIRRDDGWDFETEEPEPTRMSAIADNAPESTSPFQWLMISLGILGLLAMASILGTLKILKR